MKETLAVERIHLRRSKLDLQKRPTLKPREPSKYNGVDKEEGKFVGQKSVVTHLLQPSGRVPSGRLIRRCCGGKCPLLYSNVRAALDGKEDEATEQRISHQEGTYPEVYNAALEERVLAGLVRHAAEAKASHLPRRMRFRAVRRGPLQGRRIAIVRGLKALVSSVMSRAVLLHSPYSRPTGSPNSVRRLAFVERYLRAACRSHLSTRFADSRSR